MSNLCYPSDIMFISKLIVIMIDHHKDRGLFGLPYYILYLLFSCIGCYYVLFYQQEPPLQLFPPLLPPEIRYSEQRMKRSQVE